MEFKVRMEGRDGSMVVGERGDGMMLFIMCGLAN
jgi:hypothetical protein